MDVTIPVVIVHRGYKRYLENNIKITSKKNYIYLIGDQSLKHLENKYQNLKYIFIEDMINSEVLEYKKYFVNYSTNNSNFEWHCFERIFILEKFIKQYKYEKIFHIDSDNVLLVNVNNLKYLYDTAFCIPNFQNNFRMDASIHSGLLSKSFINQFKTLYVNIYINKSKFELIEQKINYHKINNIKGGVCDMTLYYLIFKDNLIDIQNLLHPVKDFDGKEYIFMNNLNLSEGYLSKNNFKVKNGKIKIYKDKSVLDIVKNKKFKLANIHFQGSSKKYLNKLATFKY